VHSGMDDDSRTDREDKDEGKSDSETEDEVEDKKFFLDDNQPPAETNYVENAVEELGQVRWNWVRCGTGSSEELGQVRNWVR